MQSSYPNRLLDARPSLPEPSDILDRFRTLVLDGPDAIDVAPFGAPAPEPTVDEAPPAEDADVAQELEPAQEPGLAQEPELTRDEPSEDAEMSDAELEALTAPDGDDDGRLAGDEADAELAQDSEPGEDAATDAAEEDPYA